MAKVTNLIRVGGGKKAVPAYYREHASEKSKSLQHIYHNKVEYFDVEGSKTQEERHIVQADCEEILDTIKEVRQLEGIPTVKIMADGGQGFLKICASIYPENYSPELDRGLSEEELNLIEDLDDLNSPVKKRSLYENGGTAGQKGNLNGVHTFNGGHCP